MSQATLSPVSPAPMGSDPIPLDLFNPADAIALVTAIFKPREWVEIRTIRPDPHDPDKAEIDSRWIQAVDFADIADCLVEPNRMSNIYFGANPRKAHGLRGNDNCLPAHAFFVDVDFYKDAMTFEATLVKIEARIREYHLPDPSFIINSGNGVWPWWMVEDDIPLDRWQAYMSHLIEIFGGDKACKNPERVCRLPGTLNHGFGNPNKSEFSWSSICGGNRKRYALADFPGYSATDPAAAVEAPKDITPAVVAGVEDGDIINKLNSAKNAAKFKTLWAGGFPEGTRSEKVASLLCLIAFYTQDANQIERIASQSPLCLENEKWRSKWRHTQIAAALAFIADKEKYSPKHPNFDVVADWDSSIPAKVYSPTNLGDGQLFADTYHDEILYVSEWKRWLRWDGQRWSPAGSEVIRRHAHRLVVEVMPTIAKGIASDEERAKYYKHTATSHQTFQLDAMLKEATAYMSVPVERLDSDTMLFNLQNGTLDCRTGEVRAHRREDYITKISPCKFDPAAICPTWDKFLKRILPPELITYLQTVMGYSMTGSVQEECMLVLHGNGANGKSTLLDAMLHCLGDYGQAMQPSVLLADNRQGGNSDDIARLHGVRCAVAVETGDGGRLNCEKVKAITGGDRIAACRKYEHPFEFQPTHKIWLATNHEPKVSGEDDGIWRRIHKVPFDASISEAEKDTSLKGRNGKLAQEADGIMAWMIQGLKTWLAEGLRKPEAVRAATAKYREDSDIFGQFLADTCVQDAHVSVKAGELFTAYKRWADDNGINFTITAHSMAKKLQDRGYKGEPKRDGKYWLGLAIRQDHDAPKDDDKPF